jgi:lysophospholipase L1-like esterase
MQLDLIEIHNAVPERAATGGWKLPRYPEPVRAALNTRGRWIAAQNAGVELRFVVDGPECAVTLRNPGEATEVHVYRGSFQMPHLPIGAGQTRRFLLARPAGWGDIEPAALRSGGWDPAVWRLRMDNADLELLEVDPLGSAIRPPLAAEKPALRWLAYGSSITHSFLHGYPQVAARTLHVDVLNKGMSGSCHIEPEAADWLATLDFDFATLELGINMRGAFEPDAFERRARHLVDKLRAARPQAPLVLITHFINREHQCTDASAVALLRQRAFDDALRRIHAGAADPRLHLIEGTEILDDFSLLAADLIHPTHDGHARMGQNLAARLRPLIG